jgi:predicted ABC-type ATPase
MKLIEIINQYKHRTLYIYNHEVSPFINYVNEDHICSLSLGEINNSSALECVGTAISRINSAILNQTKKMKSIF